ncbi:carbon-nitrogen hydrolase family protein [Croceiramulus getboli]|nr:carbon-nitrogen hydrolase family protein [Flavobacteriaceae bacterium YJPT1-3]
MKIALAQIASIPGGLEKNSQKHLAYIQHALKQKADLILFPELSITGYHPSRSKEWALSLDDALWEPFKKLAKGEPGSAHQQTCTIGLGVPLQEAGKPAIAHLFFHPDKRCSVYRKQLLHQDEQPYFQAGTQPLLFPLKDHQIAPAICYEALQPQHAQEAVRLGADVYVVAVAKDQSGMVQAQEYFPKLARKHRIFIALVNSVGANEGFTSAGGSAVWTPDGNRQAPLSQTEEGLLIYHFNKRTVHES